MILGLQISFYEFLSNFHLNEKTYLLVSQCIIWKSIFFLKCKPNDIQTNSFSIHAWPLWEANTHAQFILDPYIVVAYYTFYLTKIDKIYHTRNVDHIGQM
jgi:hypothetical protein